MRTTFALHTHPITGGVGVRRQNGMSENDGFIGFSES